ncbi:glycosyltransferase family 4 protein [Butyrivibrio fibrisolvens]|uniref:glycosyltransferase family 4 protein n=1 Tax=Butyrivibrio fibrisolvens TaxID=831 RepID=UPI00040866AB|nr:glycosyltransferase family 1 protein [Butyrivibrio fibrisolvens]
MVLLYDITLLTNKHENSSARSGLYNCAYNILAELTKNNAIEVKYYCDPRVISKYRYAIEDFSIDSPINLTNLNFFFSSVREYAINLRNQKKKENKLFSRKALTLAIKVIEHIIAILPSNMDLSGVDCFFSPHGIIPNAILRMKSIKKAQILHDLIPLVLDVNLDKTWSIKLINSMQNDVLYFSNSENTKKDFIHFNSTINEKNIIVVPHACSPMFNDAIISESSINQVRKKYDIDSSKYIFSLCSLAPNKNLVRIVRTFLEFIETEAINDLLFVIGGASWDHPYTNELFEKIGKMKGFHEYIKMIGYVDNCDLPSLYAGGLFFVYTSLYEGFGVPPLEAMTCGCPVIVSNSSSLPEVVGDAAIKIDCQDDNQHIEAYKRYYYDDDYRAKMASNGRKRSKLFSWKITTKKMIDYITENLQKENGLNEIS